MSMWVINCKKVPLWWRDVGSGGGCACVGAGDVWEISVPFSQFCLNCSKKNSLKKGDDSIMQPRLRISSLVIFIL